MVDKELYLFIILLIILINVYVYLYINNYKIPNDIYKNLGHGYFGELVIIYESAMRVL